MNLEEKTIKKEKVYSGNIFDIFEKTVLLPNGKEAKREILEHIGACAILPITSDGKIVMVKQFRSSIDQIILEIPAGRLEKGEDPKDAAIRELEEECGYLAKDVKEYIKMYPAAGYSSEAIYIYIAKDLVKTQTNPDEDEFLEILEMDPKELKEMILRDEIPDSKTIMSILKYVVENNI